MDDVGNKGEIKAVLPRRERERKRRLLKCGRGYFFLRFLLCDEFAIGIGGTDLVVGQISPEPLLIGYFWNIEKFVESFTRKFLQFVRITQKSLWI